MTEAKTKPTTESVKAFVDAVEDPDRRRDVRTIMKMMKAASGARPKMWGESIIGYGSYTYRYASGLTGDWPLAGLSPRARNITLYIMSGFASYEALLAKLGKHKTGKSCLYFNKLADVDEDVLAELISASINAMKTKHA